MSDATIGLIGRMMGAAFLPLLIGWAVAFSQKRKRNAVRMPKGPLILGAVLALGLAANSMVIQLRENARVQVTRVEQPAPGATDADLTPDYLRQVAASTVAETAREVPEFPTTTSTALVQQNGKTLGVIRFKTKGVTPVVAVLGLVNGNIIRIVCARSDFGDVDLRSPECSQALQADFGTTP